MKKLLYRLREISPKDIVMILYEQSSYNTQERSLIEDVHFDSIISALRFIGLNYPNASEDMDHLYA